MRWLVLTAILISTPARAQYFVSGNDLYNDCQNNHSWITAYVLGAMDATLVIPGHEKLYCIPPNAIGAQMADVICKALTENPADRAADGSYLVMRYLQKAFPCA